MVTSGDGNCLLHAASLGNNITVITVIIIIITGYSSDRDKLYETYLPSHVTN